MKEQISALMDGQLAERECEGCLNSLKSDGELRQSWDVYHLIGDALRGHVQGALPRSFDERLKQEPTILAPQRKKTAPPMRWAMSAAAGVAAVGFVAWMAQPFFGGQTEQLAANPAGATPSEIVALPVRNIDDYQLAHQRFAPGPGLTSAAPYVRTVAGGGGQP